MHEPTYRQALSHAWELIWHNKVLWVFGLLSVSVSHFGLNDFISQLIFLTDRSHGTYFALFIQFLSSLKGWGVAWFVWLMIVLMALAALVIFVVISSQGALLSAVAQYYQSRKHPNLSKAWDSGAKNFFKLFILSIFKVVSFFGLVVLTQFFLTKIQFVSLGASTLESLILISISLFLALAFSTILFFATCYAVIDQDGVWLSVRKGWSLFKEHILVSFELSIITLIINVIVLTILSFSSFWVFIPSFIFTLLAGLTGYNSLLSVGVILSLFCFFVFVALLGALHNAFITSAWVYLFMKMHHEGVVSRAYHWVRKIM